MSLAGTPESYDVVTRRPSVSSSSSSATCWNGRAEIELHLVAQRDQRRVCRCRLRVAGKPAGIDAGQRHRGGEPKAEFRLQAGARGGDVADAVARLVQR